MADKSILVLCYSRCTTCKRALKWLDEHGVSYTLRDIKEENPTAEELAEWHKLSGLSIRKFFNTSGMVYRDNNIKEQLDAGMSDSDAYNLLATTVCWSNAHWLLQTILFFLDLKSLHGKKHFCKLTSAVCVLQHALLQHAFLQHASVCR